MLPSVTVTWPQLIWRGEARLETAQAVTVNSRGVNETLRKCPPLLHLTLRIFADKITLQTSVPISVFTCSEPNIMKIWLKNSLTALVNRTTEMSIVSFTPQLVSSWCSLCSFCSICSAACSIQFQAEGLLTILIWNLSNRILILCQQDHLLNELN